MASKRMFRIDLVTSDAFLDMPLTAQGLFFIYAYGQMTTVLLTALIKQ